MHAPSRPTRRAPRSNRGLVLVAAVGILGVLSVMSLTFATVMRLEAKAARNFTVAVRAEFVARAGVEDGIARLRSMARDGAELPYDDGTAASWYTWRGTEGGGWKGSFIVGEDLNALDDDGDGSVDAADNDELAETSTGYTDWVSSTYVEGGDRYCLTVQDAASKINVNAGDNLGVILDNLCRLIGPPLVPARQRALVPRWYANQRPQYRDALNAGDTQHKADFFYQLDGHDRPVTTPEGCPVFGDGYAIAGYRARHGAFLSLEDVRNALTWTERGDGDQDGEVEPDTPEERLEVEAKFAAIRPHLTIDSWTDTDQIGYGKFEQIATDGRGYAIRLTDRNKTWNVNRYDGEGELKGCLVAIINGVGQGQLKTIARNTIDTIILDESVNANSAMRVPPNHDSSYIIIGRDHRGDNSWQEEAKLYARQPLSIHRAPVNVNTATDKVLVSLLMGLQTNWGPAGYYTNSRVRAVVADALSTCPSVISLGRDTNNALLTFELPCPNDSAQASRLHDEGLVRYGHPDGGSPFCFFCNHGRPYDGGSPGHVNEAHYVAWQILKEREQANDADRARDSAHVKRSNGAGSFKGWDDLYFRVFKPWERATEGELHVRARQIVLPSRAAGVSGVTAVVGASSAGHPGIARLCMANFNSNTDILKFQPNIEWINRWGANFTDLYITHPDLMSTEDIKLRVRPGELLDKSDLNIGTTELTFDSGGVYEVTSTGRVYDDKGVVAEKKYSALIRVYDVWRESTQREFVMGKISNALGAPGTCTAGQIAVDEVSARRPTGAAPVRKSLCTYPEAIVPGSCVTAAGKPPALALATGRDDRGNPTNVQSAGYDGQIMLATNMYMTGPDDKPADVGFYNSFTGDVDANVAGGSPTTTENFQPLDEVSLLGALDSTDYDVAPVKKGNEVVEGEGRGGDLRPDGVFLGIVGREMLDGTLNYDSANNFNSVQGALTMWVKPTWHHGTVMKASLPVGYDPFGGDEKGSTVLMRQNWRYAGTRSSACRRKWPAGVQHYASDTDRNGLGYVRDRFEHEFFNAAIPGTGWGAKAFRFGKMGDLANSEGDGDCQMGKHGRDYSVPFAALMFDYEGTDRGIMDFACYTPGWLYPDSRPFYRIAPYRWFFVGILWNYMPPGREPVYNCGIVNDGLGRFKWQSTYGRSEMSRYFHRINGQPLEITIESGLPSVPDYDGAAPLDQDGQTVSNTTPYGDHKGRTAKCNLTLAMAGRPFIDTMRSWNKRPRIVDDIGGSTVYYGTRPSTNPLYDVESWAYEHYGTMMQGDIRPGNDSHFTFLDFGVNRAAPEGQHFYQKIRSGTYATIDELTIHSRWQNPTTDAGFDWPKHQRSPGRYYFQRTPDRNRLPTFTSQTLFDSELAQTFKFAQQERDEVIELGTVRWTVFTPHYCVHQPGVSDYEFPYDTYFVDAVTTAHTSDIVSQSTRPGRTDWSEGPRSRNSSLRGCIVSIDTRGAPVPTDAYSEYQDPEAWAPVFAKGARNGQHARATPETLRYVVRFAFSNDEYRRATADAVLLDTPVFDDITLTYMRRPKVLTWRDVSE